MQIVSSYLEQVVQVAQIAYLLSPYVLRYLDHRSSR